VDAGQSVLGPPSCRVRSVFTRPGSAWSPIGRRPGRRAASCATLRR